LCVPAILAGQFAGNRMFHRIDIAVFKRLVYAILFLSAGVAVVGAISGL